MSETGPMEMAATTVIGTVNKLATQLSSTCSLPQANKYRASCPKAPADSHPDFTIRFKFDPRSQQPAGPEPRRHFRTRGGAKTTAPISLDKEPLSEQPRPSPNEPILGLTVFDGAPEDAKSPHSDPIPTIGRFPPNRVDAEIALRRVNVILHPPQDTGRGYKLCKLDTVTHTRYQSVAMCLWFFLVPNSTFIDASWDTATAVGRGKSYTRRVRQWTREFIATGQVPNHNYGKWSRSLLEDEDIASEIKLHLRGKGKYISAEDVARFVNDPSVQQRLGISNPMSVRTAQRWLRKMGYCWGKEKKGQYFDGHEREDVVQYRQGVFLPAWKSLEPFMASWDHDTGLELPLLLQSNQRQVTVWLHDATTAYAHNRRKTRWVHADEHATPLKKGQGVSVMFADYISPRYDFLRSRDGKFNARKIMRAGKGREGYLTNDNICDQFRRAVNLVKREYPDEDHVFIYDNARIHTKRPVAAPSARLMTKGESDFQVQTKNKEGKQIKLKMQNPTFPDGSEQELYLPNGRFKGMAALLQERGYDTEGLKAECQQGFKCQDPTADCCCRRILYNLIDVKSGQKSILELLAAELGTRVIFLPKYHCELNPIEQCWGYAKRLYRMAPPSSLTADVEKNMLQALGSIPLESIRRFVARSRRFIDAYDQGLDGPNAAASAWVQKRFQGHRTTPEHIYI